MTRHKFRNSGNIGGGGGGGPPNPPGGTGGRPPNPPPGGTGGGPPGVLYFNTTSVMACFVAIPAKILYI